MYETANRYREIVAREVEAQQRKCRCTIRDGERGRCPRCGMPGIWDTESIGFGHDYGNSIYYSTVFYEWRCSLCDIRRDF